jgi:hypothetical protein
MRRAQEVGLWPSPVRARQPYSLCSRSGVCPATHGIAYARPDDVGEDGIPWRKVLLKYNEERPANPLGLYPAWKLYDNKTYGRLVDRFGFQNVFILSAGWGMISAEFLTPYYDITFNNKARNPQPYKYRRRTDRYDDFRMLPDSSTTDMVFSVARTIFRSSVH